jgi:hypothetical protein
VQALTLMKVCTNKQVAEAAEGAHIAELEENNAKLLADLKQTRLAHAEVDAARNSLSVNHGKLEEECAGFRTTVDALEQEKAKAVAARKAEITTMRKKIQDYRVHHRKKFHELRVNLEKAVNEIGMRCLLYLGKNSTIGKIVVWFGNEIHAESSESCRRMQTVVILRSWRLS